MESWPVLAAEYEIQSAEVAAHLEALRALMKSERLDALIVTSGDRYLNEYTPRLDNHRYLLSGFSGSTALMLVPAVGRAKLYVDGRYHIQADQEVDPALIEVVKVPFGTGIQASLEADLGAHGSVGYEGDRVSQRFEDALRKRDDVEFKALDNREVDACMSVHAPEPAKPIEFIDPGISGRDPQAKLLSVFDEISRPDRCVLLLSELDDIAWLSNGRGYHFLYQSSYAAVGFATLAGVHLSISQEVFDTGCSDEAPEGVHYYTDAPERVLASSAFDAMEEIVYDPAQVTPAFLRRVRQQRPRWRLRAMPNPVVAAKAIKSADELRHMEESNARSSKAISKTIKWVRTQIKQGKRVDELAYYEAANGFYEEVGARDLSFHTIAAVGSNSAIIHFSDPSASVVAKSEDLMLLDSGALYEGGLATDITRTFLAGGRASKASSKQKQIYTLVLKGMMQAMHAVFPAGTRGAFLDALARAPLYAEGFDFGHGTGHGVGIHVHEPGVGISPHSNLPLRAGQVSSIEPGIYLEGFGGVRIENVVVFEEVPEHEGFLRARPLNYVGLDENLIDDERLEPRERAWIKAYQEECQRRGTLDHEAD